MKEEIRVNRYEDHGSEYPAGPRNLDLKIHNLHMHTYVVTVFYFSLIGNQFRPTRAGVVRIANEVMSGVYKL